MNWSQEWVNAHLAKFKDEKSNDRAAVQTTDVESVVSNEPVAEKKGPRLDTPVRVHCHTSGKRLGDCDGRSIKAVLDAVVRSGILTDDSAKCVEEVSFTQNAGNENQTLIKIETT